MTPDPTEITIAGQTFKVGDKTALGDIKSFFYSGETAWCCMAQGTQYRVRLLLDTRKPIEE